MNLTTKLAHKFFAEYGVAISRGMDKNHKPPRWWGEIMLNRLEQLKYFEAPASSKFHLSVPGGLFLHSVGVVERALKLRVGMSGIPAWKIMLAGIFHDVGKCGLLCGDFLRPRYVANTPGAGYSVYHAVPDFTVRDLSALYAGRFGLPWDVMQAILTHDGLYCDQNKPYISNQCNLSLLLMNADNLQSKIFETRTEAFLSLAEGGESGVEQAGVKPGEPEPRRKVGRPRKAIPGA